MGEEGGRYGYPRPVLLEGDPRSRDVRKGKEGQEEEAKGWRKEEVSSGRCVARPALRFTALGSFSPPAVLLSLHGCVPRCALRGLGLSRVRCLVSRASSDCQVCFMKLLPPGAIPLFFFPKHVVPLADASKRLLRWF